MIRELHLGPRLKNQQENKKPQLAFTFQDYKIDNFFNQFSKLKAAPSTAYRTIHSSHNISMNYLRSTSYCDYGDDTFSLVIICNKHHHTQPNSTRAESSFPILSAVSTVSIGYWRFNKSRYPTLQCQNSGRYLRQVYPKFIQFIGHEL